jgi:hypothetical protein
MVCLSGNTSAIPGCRAGPFRRPARPGDWWYTATDRSMPLRLTSRSAVSTSAATTLRAAAVEMVGQLGDVDADIPVGPGGMRQMDHLDQQGHGAGGDGSGLRGGQTDRHAGDHRGHDPAGAGDPRIREPLTILGATPGLLVERSRKAPDRPNCKEGKDNHHRLICHFAASHSLPKGNTFSSRVQAERRCGSPQAFALTGSAGKPTVCESRTCWSWSNPKASAIAPRSIQARRTVARPLLAAKR